MDQTLHFEWGCPDVQDHGRISGFFKKFVRGYRGKIVYLLKYLFNEWLQ